MIIFFDLPFFLLYDCPRVVAQVRPVIKYTTPKAKQQGRIAQLVRAPALQAGGHRFESCFAHHLILEIYSPIAQLVEHTTVNR